MAMVIRIKGESGVNPSKWLKLVVMVIIMPIVMTVRDDRSKDFDGLLWMKGIF